MAKLIITYSIRPNQPRKWEIDLNLEWNNQLDLEKNRDIIDFMANVLDKTEYTRFLKAIDSLYFQHLDWTIVDNIKFIDSSVGMLSVQLEVGI